MLSKNKINSSGTNRQKKERNTAVLRGTVVGLSTFLIVFAIASLVTPIQNTSAADDCTSSVTDTITCTKNQNLSVAVRNNPLYYYINVVSTKGSAGTPIAMAFGSEDGRTAFGNIASSSDSVYVETNSPLTHQLMLSTTGTHTVAGIDSSLVANNLVSTGTVVSGSSLMANTYFAPGGGSSINSATTLGENTWGFALENDSAGIPENNFDADYSSPTLTSKWAQVPNSGNEVLVRQDNEPASTTDIYYGVYAQKNIAGGEYSNVMLYTALAEQPSQIRVTPAQVAAGSTITIYTSINTTNISGETAAITFYQLEGDTKVEKATCTNPTVALDANNYLYATCTVPTLTENGTYGVQLALTNFATTLSQDDIFTYSSTAPQSDPQQVADNNNSSDNNTNSITPTQSTSSLSNSRSGIAFAPASTNASSSDSSSDDNASSSYNSPLGANSSDKSASTVASTTKQVSEEGPNPIVVAAIAAGTIAVGAGAIFAIAKKHNENEEEDY